MAAAAGTLAKLAPPITVREWGELPENAGVELANGRLVEKPAVAMWHDFLGGDLFFLLGAHARSRDLGRFAGFTTRLKISVLSGREPDLFFIPKEMFGFVGKNVFYGVPPLAIEILSPRNEYVDRGEKYVEYARLGIREYWIVDLPHRCLEVHRLKTLPDGSRAYELAETHRDDAVFRPTLFPGPEIPLAGVWPTEFENRTDP
jgi:Uma2 family endonuclease